MKYRIALGEKTYFIHDLVVDAPSKEEGVPA